MAVFFTWATLVGTLPVSAQAAEIPQKRLTLPPVLGKIEKFESGTRPSAPFIFQIQDAHAQPAAQESIRKILSYLNHQTSVLVAFEGGLGPLHPEYLNLFAHYPEANQAVIQDLASKGELTGTEQYALEEYGAGKSQPRFAGVETPELYRENLETYRLLLFKREAIDKLLKPLKEELESAGSRTFSPDLRQFLQERERRKSGNYGTGTLAPQTVTYFHFLISEVKKRLAIDLEDPFEQIRFPQLARVLALEKIQKDLNGEKAGREKEELLKLIQRFAALNEVSNPRALAEELWQESRNRKIDLSAYPNYLKSVGAAILQSELEPESLFDEIDLLEEGVIEKLATRPEEERLVERFKKFALLEKLLRLELTNKDFDKIELLDESVPSELENFKSQALRFYTSAKARDEALLENTLRAAEKFKSKQVVLITGGFHASGVTELMKEKGLGYALIRPRISEVRKDNPYLKVLRDENVDLSSYVKSSPLNKQESLLLKELLETAMPVLASKYQIQPEEMASQLAAAVNQHPILSKKLSARSDGPAVEFLFKERGAQTTFGPHSPITPDKKITSKAVGETQFLSDPVTYSQLRSSVNKEGVSVDPGFRIHLGARGVVSSEALARSEARATRAEIETGVRYWKGELKTTPIERPFRASRKEDVVDINDLSEEEGRKLEKLAVESLLEGKGYISMLVAGASGRMNIKEAPEEAEKMVGGAELKSKAAVPVGVTPDGRVTTYFGEFGENLSRLLQSVDQAAQEAGLQSQVWENDVAFLSNDEYRPEHERLLKENNFYGLKPEQIHFFHQPLGAKFVGTPADVDKIKSQFKDEKGNYSEEKYQQAMANSREVERRLAEGDEEAVILKGERDPLGHGEYFHQLVVSGELLRMIDSGKQWGFVKNVDNYAAKFDKVWLRILGLFLERGLDFQPEVSPRSPGQKGGSLIIMTDNSAHQLAEDPNIQETNRVKGHVMDLIDSYWFNDAVAFYTVRYEINLYKKEGQSDQEFIEELRRANPEEREAIAERGRRKFPRIFDAKPAKSLNAAIKGETNMWQSSGVVSPEMKIAAVGVRGARNFPIEEYYAMTPEQKTAELAKLRFLSTKNWTKTALDVKKARTEMEANLGRPVSDRELWITLETYEGNKIISPDLIRYNREAELVTPGILGRSEVRATAWPQHTPEKIAVIGTGFVGTALAVLTVTDWGHDAMGIDVDPEKIANLQKGKLNIYEPGMEELLNEGLQSGRLHFTTDLAQGIEGRDLIFLALPTPQSDTGEANVGFLEKVVRGIGQIVQPGEEKILIIKSTAPPSTERHLGRILDRELASRKLKKKPVIHFVRIPEFVREGKALEDDRKKSGRVVIGANNKSVLKRNVDLYKPEYKNPKYERIDLPIVTMDLRSAPLVKYAANGYRGEKISFINFVGWLTEALGLDINDVANAIGEDPRILRSFLDCGVGFGGSCFPKDFAAFVRIAKQAKVPADLLLDALAINEFQWRHFFDQIDRRLDGLKGKTILILGGAFKPDTSDVREARSILLIKELLKQGADVRVLDPEATRPLSEEFRGDRRITYYDDPPSDLSIDSEMLEGVDAVVLVTEWQDFKKLDFGKLKQKLEGENKLLPQIFDGRNFWDPAEMKRLGFPYLSIGRSDQGRLTEQEQVQFKRKIREFFLAFRVSFMNLLAEIADAENANIRDIRKGFGFDPVVFGDDADASDAYLSPGLGFGGHNLPSAVSFVEKLTRKHLGEELQEYRRIRRNLERKFGFKSSFPAEEENRIPFATAIREINERQIPLYLKKAKKAAGGNLKDKKVAVLGLAFNPKTSSIENAPSLALIKALIKEGAIVLATDEDGQAVQNAKRYLDEYYAYSEAVRAQIFYFWTPQEAVAASDLQILVTEWPEYLNLKGIFTEREPSEEGVKVPLPAAFNMVDGRHFYSPEEVRALGGNYYTVGVPRKTRSEIRPKWVSTLEARAQFLDSSRKNSKTFYPDNIRLNKREVASASGFVYGPDENPLFINEEIAILSGEIGSGWTKEEAQILGTSADFVKPGVPSSGIIVRLQEAPQVGKEWLPLLRILFRSKLRLVLEIEGSPVEARTFSTHLLNYAQEFELVIPRENLSVYSVKGGALHSGSRQMIVSRAFPVALLSSEPELLKQYLPWLLRVNLSRKTKVENLVGTVMVAAGKLQNLPKELQRIYSPEELALSSGLDLGLYLERLARLADYIATQA